ncbi:hypothetical protein CRG98_005040 [Punica granatum]|uniref:Phorbol-ester/DAG-type domain-containing protein n=1 Tax=Punica granatum TaxID=22663 RepID=A0A2I0L252_PUNGR|nr:hypothetical protein CRG98_005040 [Punica granatum]
MASPSVVRGPAARPPARLGSGGNGWMATPIVFEVPDTKPPGPLGSGSIVIQGPDAEPSTLLSSGRMATPAVQGLAAKPSGGLICKFKLKRYETAFMCNICMVDSYDTEGYHCNHCNLSRHKGCIKLASEINIDPGPNDIFRGGNQDLNMHPCCAELARHNRVPYELQLEEQHKCVWCSKDRPPEASHAGPMNYFCWSYKLTETGGRRYRIHVHCYRKMVNRARRSIVQSGHNARGGNHPIEIVLKGRGNGDTGRGNGDIDISWERLLRKGANIILNRMT